MTVRIAPVIQRWRRRLLSLPAAIASRCLDLRYGGGVSGPGRPKPAAYQALAAYSFTNSGYVLLEQMFEGRISATDVLVDVGCGRGRVINFWLHRGHRGPIYGLELDEAYAATTARRLVRWPNVRILQGDAVRNLPPDGTLFYLFNPFGPDVMRRFRDSLRDRGQRCGNVRVVYFAPTCLEVWTGEPGWRVDVFDLDVSLVAGHAERHRRYAVITADRTAAT